MHILNLNSQPILSQFFSRPLFFFFPLASASLIAECLVVRAEERPSFPTIGDRIIARHESAASYEVPVRNLRTFRATIVEREEHLDETSL